MRKGFVYGNKRLIDLFNNRPGLKERVDEINAKPESPTEESSAERNNSSQDDNR